MENATNCLSVEKIIAFCNKTKISADYILLGRPNYLDDKTADFLSTFDENDVESIFSIIRLTMRMIESANK